VKAEREEWPSVPKTDPKTDPKYELIAKEQEGVAVRVDGAVCEEAVLIDTSVDRAGKRWVLGVLLSLSEAEMHCREFLSGLVARGLMGCNC